MRINAALAGEKDPRAFLSPAQARLLDDVRRALDGPSEAKAKKLRALQPVREVHAFEAYTAKLRGVLGADF